MKQWLAFGAAGQGVASEKLKVTIKCELTMQFTDPCFMCGKTNHRKSDCWWNEAKFATSPSASKARGKGKRSKGFGKGGKKGAKGTGKGYAAKRVTFEAEECQFCGLTGPKQSECWKFLAAQRQASTLGSSTDGQGRKRQKVSECPRIQECGRSGLIQSHPLERFNHSRTQSHRVWTEAVDAG